MKSILVGKPTHSSSITFPFFEARLPAGFPSPAEDHLEQQLDLHAFLVKHPAATFFIKIEGDSMTGAGMHSGDILIVDRSLAPQSGKIIVALINGEFTVKRLKVDGKRIFLLAENPLYPPMEIVKGMEFQVWGIVTYVIHSAS